MTVKKSEDGKRAESARARRVPSSKEILAWLVTNEGRMAVAGIALFLIVIAEVIHPSPLQSTLTDIGFVGLFAAALLLVTRRVSHPTIIDDSPAEPSRGTWLWTIFILGECGALSVQSWFGSTTAIAGGDVAPPLGLAWIGRIFQSFGWSGSNLGAPSNNQTQLPWALVDELTHWLGGSGALAQRVWYTALVACIFMAAGSLARSLRFSPLAGVIVALVYFFNPTTMSFVGGNPVFLVTMVVIPALACALVSYANARIALWKLCAIFVVAAPFVGFAYQNPPVVLMIVLTTAATPALIGARFGRTAAGRALYGAIVGGALLLGASTYWLVPALSSLSTVASGSLSTFSAWAFTESRTTLTNGFWLNTTWGWAYPLYYPFASQFSSFPFLLIPALVPLIAFGLLALRRIETRLGESRVRFAGLISLFSLVVIFLSTGTRSPGNLLFDPLYHLPYGWLLREPGRFLIAVSLGFALLNGLLVESFSGRGVLPGRFLREGVTWRGRPMTFHKRAVVAGVAVIVALSSSFPLWTGAIIAGPREGFPSTHVVIPNYWNDLASYLNSSSAPRGTLLVLPPDDFYQMPYNWYYGNDGFIPNLLDRHVVVPSAEGYAPSTVELLDAVRLEASTISKGQWGRASQLLSAMDTPVVLVRGDIDAIFPDRSIDSPAKLSSRLAADPEMLLVHRNGPLSIYVIKPKFWKPLRRFVTVNSTSPRLSELALVPAGTALVSSSPVAGHDAIFQLPVWSRWNLRGDVLTTSIDLPQGLRYNAKTLNTDGSKYVTTTFNPAPGGHLIDATLHVKVGSNSLVAVNATNHGWGSVGNCDDISKVTSSDVFSASSVSSGVPYGETALRLGASIDSACVAQKIRWSGGLLFLQLEDRNLNGATPRLCLWQEPSNSCALLAPLSSKPGWHRFTSVVAPMKGTTSMSLFLYADALGNGTTTINEYAGVTVHSIPLEIPPVVSALDERPSSNARLMVAATGYSTQWSGPTHALHVVVDGLRNGWIIRSSSTGPVIAHDGAVAHEGQDEIALTFATFFFVAAMWWFTRRSRRTRATQNEKATTGR